MYFLFIVLALVFQTVIVVSTFSVCLDWKKIHPWLFFIVFSLMLGRRITAFYLASVATVSGDVLEWDRAIFPFAISFFLMLAIWSHLRDLSIASKKFESQRRELESLFDDPEEP